MKVENMDQKEIQTVKEENDEEDLEYSLDEHVSPKEVKNEDVWKIIERMIIKIKE